MRRLASWLVALVLTVCGPGLSANSSPPTESTARSSRSGSEQALLPSGQDRFVSVGGAKLHVKVFHPTKTPKGPMILFESGGGADSTAWTDVIARLAPETRQTLVTYDRAGRGKSDALENPYDIYEEVARLHKALFRLGLGREVVLVGHSFGGYLIQLYANLYPEEVAGMIYVDPNTFEGMGGLEWAKESVAKTTKEMLINPKYDGRMFLGFLDLTEVMRRTPAPCGVPITVISQGKGDLLAGHPKWREAHEALAKRTGAKLVYAQSTGHMIPNEAPQIIVDEIRDLMKAIGSRKKAWFVPANADCGTSPPDLP